MLKKNSRVIRFVKLSLKSKIKNSRNRFTPLKPREGKKDPLYVCLKQLEAQLSRLDEKSLVQHDADHRLSRGLRKVDMDGDYITLLWGAGDRETVNPCFWNASTDDTREEPPMEGEKVAYSAHLLVKAEYLPALGGYVGCLEEVPHLSITAVQKSLQYFFTHYVRLFSGKKDSDEERTPLSLKIKVDSLASRSFQDALRSGLVPLEIIAESESEGAAFDENFTQKEKKVIRLKAIPETPPARFREVFSRLLGKKDKFQRISIKFRETDRTQRVLGADRSKDVKDLYTYLFSQRERIYSPVELKQCSDIIVPKIKKDMKAMLGAEIKKLRKVDNGDGE